MAILFGDTTYQELVQYRVLKRYRDPLLFSSFRDSGGGLHLTIFQKSRIFEGTKDDGFEALVDFKYLRIIAAIKDRVSEVQIHLLTEDVLRRVICPRVLVILAPSTFEQTQSDAENGIPIGVDIELMQLRVRIEEEINQALLGNQRESYRDFYAKRRPFYEDVNDISNLFATILADIYHGENPILGIKELLSRLNTFLGTYIVSKNPKLSVDHSHLQRGVLDEDILKEFQGKDRLPNIEELYKIFGEMVRLGIERL